MGIETFRRFHWLRRFHTAFKQLAISFKFHSPFARLNWAFVRIITMLVSLTQLTHRCAIGYSAFVTQVRPLCEKRSIKTLWILTCSLRFESSLKIASVDDFLATPSLILKE